MASRFPSIVALFVTGLVSINSLAHAQDNPPPPPPEQGQGGPGDQGGPGGGPQNNQGGQRQNTGWHIIPPFMLQRLQLTSEQQDKIKELDAKVKAEMEKILSPEQMKMLNEGRPPRMQGQGGQGGPGGQGGSGGQGQGGQGGQGGGQGGPQRNNRPPRQDQNN